ncbi:MAG TPA: hypothetical protein VJ891_15550 [Casimicrobiaceae bacterium]|nr:hypothetical protein [Casimicrobiaceae bacterium]
MNANPPRAFRYLRRETLVSTETPAELEWLRDCLAPHFRETPAGNGDWRVAFSTDSVRFGEIMSRRRHPRQETLPFFALDSQLVSLPRWNADDEHETLAFDEEFDVFFSVRRDRHEVDVLAREPRPWTRVALLRVVRELAMEEGVEGGRVFLHAAAFEHDGVVYVIAGPKYGGKTSLLIHALTSGEAQFVANDRVLLDHCADGCVVRGMPTLVNVRAETRRFFERFFEPHAFGPDSGCLTRDEHNVERQRGVTRRDEALILNPRQFADALGTAASTGGRLGAILFPVVSAAVDGCEIDELTPAETRPLLAAALFPTLARYGKPTAFGSHRPDASIEEALPSRIEAQRIPLLRCALGLRAYDDRASMLLDALRTRVDAR